MPVADNDSQDGEVENNKWVSLVYLYDVFELTYQVIEELWIMHIHLSNFVLQKENKSV
jgi:hypothetical protein